MKQLENILKLEEEASTIIALIPSDIFNLSLNDKLEFVKNNFDVSLLHSYVHIGTISEKTRVNLGILSDIVKLSVNTIVKNKLTHPEITINDYKNINKYIKSAEYILQKNNKNIIYFKYDKNLYQFVIKTTQNKQENYLTTFHLSNIKQLKKDLKRYRKIK